MPRSIVDGGGASAGRPAIQTAAQARTNYRSPTHPNYRQAAPLGRAIGLAPPQAAATEAHFDPTGAPTPPPIDVTPAPTSYTSGSGRVGSIGGGGGAGGVPSPAMFVPPEAVTAAPVAAQPPPVVTAAPPSATNVSGQTFSSVGSPGAFGAYDRLRQSRGPMSGLSVTPEMI